MPSIAEPCVSATWHVPLIVVPAPRRKVLNAGITIGVVQVWEPTVPPASRSPPLEGREWTQAMTLAPQSGPLCSDTWQVLLVELAGIAELGAAKASVAEIPTAVTRSAACMANKCRNRNRVADFISASIAGGFDITAPAGDTRDEMTLAALAEQPDAGLSTSRIAERIGRQSPGFQRIGSFRTGRAGPGGLPARPHSSPKLPLRCCFRLPEELPRPESPRSAHRGPAASRD